MADPTHDASPPSHTTASSTMTRAFLPGRWRFAPLVGALVLGVVGVLVFLQVERSAKASLAEGFQALLGSAVSGLEFWMESRIEAVETFSRSPLLVDEVEALLARAAATDDPPSIGETAESRAVAELLGRVLTLGFHDALVVRDDGLVLAGATGQLVGARIPPEKVEELAPVFAGGTTLSHPFHSSRAFEDEDGQVRVGVPIMFAASGVKSAGDGPRVLLALMVRPKQDFTRLLEVVRAGDTGEVYAFDRDGLLLSESRFDDQLRLNGLLPPDPRVDSLLRLQIRDPGVDLTAGGVPALPRDEQPLTRMAAAATASGPGVDVDGYRDYRGVEVVGAWTWLGEHDFGVAVEQDKAEAYAPLTVLRTAFAALFGLLVLVALALVFAGRLLHLALGRMRRAMRRAERLGQYTLERKLGEGGMGEVWLAQHAMLRRPTAVKLLPPSKNDPDAIVRFEREVQLTAELSHPNTITIYDYGRTPEGIFYYAMEYVAGIDLKTLVQREGPLPQARVVHIVGQICGSLAEAHGRGLIHRDIKPANIMLCAVGGEGDVVRVLDFGLVKEVEKEDVELTAAGTITGTPQYIAPESILNSKSSDARSDLYAVGAVAYWLLTGRPIFEAESAMEFVAHHLNTAPELPSVRAGVEVDSRLEAAIMACLAKKPEDRPQSAEELEDRLEGSVDVPWTREDARRAWGKEAPIREAAAPSAEGSDMTHTMSIDVAER